MDLVILDHIQTISFNYRNFKHEFSRKNFGLKWRYTLGTYGYNVSKIAVAFKGNGLK